MFDIMYNKYNIPIYSYHVFYIRQFYIFKMKDPIRFLRLERELIENKIEDLKSKLINESPRVLLQNEKIILDLWKSYEKKLHAILDIILRHNSDTKNIIKPSIHSEFIKEIKTRLCESEFYLTLIRESYLKTKLPDILLIQAIPEWNDYHIEERGKDEGG